jgi:Zn-dependent protease with chaperone function
MNGGVAIFYDGLTARRRPAVVDLGAESLTVTDGGGGFLARWLYVDLRQQDAPAGCLRLAAANAPELARLDVVDAALANEILRRTPQIGSAARASRTGKATIVFWSLAAATSLVLTALYLVPHLAERLAPLVPLSVERRLGDAVDNQVRAIFGNEGCSTPDGDAALGTLRAKLSDGAPLPMPVDIVVLHSNIPNAFALPGGRIYVLSGLLERAKDADEVAGVLAHEMGHVAHRDGLRLLLQSSASSFLIGLLFGDVLGGGTLVMLGRTLVDTAYTREAETAADAFAADLLLARGQSPKPLAEFLSRLSQEFGGDKKSLAILSSHPLTEDRKRALSQTEPTARGKPLLGDSAWQALKTICANAKPESAASKALLPKRKPE